MTCQFTIPDDDWSARVMIQWRFNGVDINGASEELSSGIATHTVTDFQITNEGMYSCVVSTDYWSVTSTNLFVKMAGVYMSVCLCVSVSSVSRTVSCSSV